MKRIKSNYSCKRVLHLYRRAPVKCQVPWKMQSCWCYSFWFGSFNRKKIKTFVEPLTSTSQVLKWNAPVPRDSSINTALIKPL